MNQVVEPKQLELAIYATANGYIVRRPWSPMTDRCRDDEHTHVFESFSAMVAHLRRAMPQFLTPEEEVAKLGALTITGPVKWTKKTSRPR